MWRWLLHPLWLNIVLMPTEQAQTTSLLLSSVTIGLSIHPINWTILCQTVVACSVRIQQNRTKWCKPCHTVLIILIVWFKCFHIGYFSVSNNRQCFTDNPSKHQVTISDIWRHRCQIRFISMYLCSRIQTFNTRIDESLYDLCDLKWCWLADWLDWRLGVQKNLLLYHLVSEIDSCWLERWLLEVSTSSRTPGFVNLNS